MLKRMAINNFTVFSAADLKFGGNLNVVVGENGSGKTHLLKLAYSVIATSTEEGRKPNTGLPTKSVMQTRLADKLVNVFRPESLGRLVQRMQGRGRCDVSLSFEKAKQNVAFGFATNSRSEVNVKKLPSKWIDTAAAYLPTRELLTIFPNFVSVYEGHYMEFEETWRDTCVLLGRPLQKGPREKRIRELLEPLEQAMEGIIELDKNGRFYLKNVDGRMEMPLVAEGLRKLGMLSRLIATGALLDNGYLFWDEPDANLNPKLIKGVAKSILDLGASGIQVFIATHSLFLLREIETLLSEARYNVLDSKFFGLHKNAAGVSVDQGSSIDDIGDIASLDEELGQSDRFLDIAS